MYATPSPQTFLVFEALSLAFVQSILLLRTLALWQGYKIVRYSATVALIMSSGVHFVVSRREPYSTRAFFAASSKLLTLIYTQQMYAYAGTASTLGLWIVQAAPPRGGKLRAVPYFVTLLFASYMMALTVLGAQRQAGKNYTTQELLRLQPSRGASMRREFIASRILRGQLLYYCVMVVSTGATGFLLVFDVLKGYNQVSSLGACRAYVQRLTSLLSQFIPLPLNVVLT